jgi:hypothetical protein
LKAPPCTEALIRPFLLRSPPVGGFAGVLIRALANRRPVLRLERAMASPRGGNRFVPSASYGDDQVFRRVTRR